MIFMALMALVLAAFGMLVVQRSFFEALPVGLLILGIFALVGVHVFSSRLVLEDATLTSFRYGLRLWQVDIRKAQFRETEDDIGAFMLEVLIDDRKVGSLRSTLFERVVFDTLLERMAEGAASETAP
jgi:hypothetical protein